MSVEFKCDKCGETIKPDETAMFLRCGVDELNQFADLDTPISSNTTTTWLLCNECKHAFSLFLAVKNKDSELTSENKLSDAVNNTVDYVKSEIQNEVKKITDFANRKAMYSADIAVALSDTNYKFDTITALWFLRQGLKVRQAGWDVGVYVYYHTGANIFVDEHQKPYHIPEYYLWSFEQKWKLYREVGESFG